MTATTSSAQKICAINVGLSQIELDNVRSKSSDSHMSIAGYIQNLMTKYLTTLDRSTLPKEPPAMTRTTGWGKEKQVVRFVIRLPKTLKEDFYRIAELQGYKGSSLIKILLQKENETTQP